MTGQIYLTLTQSLQLVILAPCLLMVCYLFVLSKSKANIVIPVLYFFALGVEPISLVLPVVFDTGASMWLRYLLVMGESFIPALSFLLILQFIMNRVPPFVYWFIMLIPLVAASPFVYSFVNDQQLCVTVDVCFSAHYAYHLNNVILSAFIFMLLTFVVSRKAPSMEGTKTLKLHKYWLVVSLIIFNIILLILDLRLVQGAIEQKEYLFAKTFVKLAFVYMVLRSIFRVFNYMFDKALDQDIPLTSSEVSLAEQADLLLKEQKLYRDLAFNRKVLADHLSIKEHKLSRIINKHFNKSVSEIANDYRIKEAKELLSDTDQSVTVISFDVGFSSITSFNRVFKNLVGMSPSDFRLKSASAK